MADETQTSTPAETTTPTDTQPDKNAGKGSEQAQTFTQDDVDKIVGKRAKEAAEAATRKILEQLGYTDLDTAKKEAEAARKKREAEMSEVEKANQRIADLEAKAKEADERAAAADSKRKASIVITRLEALATKAKAEIPADVVDYLQRNHAEQVASLLGEDEKVDEKQADGLIEIVRKARPNWFVKERGVGSPSISGGRTPAPDTDAKKAALNGLRKQIRGSF